MKNKITIERRKKAGVSGGTELGREDQSLHPKRRTR